MRTTDFAFWSRHQETPKTLASFSPTVGALRQPLGILISSGLPTLSALVCLLFYGPQGCRTLNPGLQFANAFGVTGYSPSHQPTGLRLLLLSFQVFPKHTIPRWDDNGDGAVGLGLAGEADEGFGFHRVDVAELFDLLSFTRRNV